jgi:predicted nucleic acid-binding protein
MRFVLDASVAMKLVFDEDDSDLAVDLMRAHAAIAPVLLAAECVNAVWRRRRMEQFSAAAAMRKIEALNEMNVEAHPLSPLVVRSAEIAFALDHPAYDCFYLALSERERAPLITADKTFVHKVHSMGVSGADVWKLSDTPDRSLGG